MTEKLDVDVTVSKDKKELSIKLRGELTLEGVAMELELLARQFSMTHLLKSNPDTIEH